MCFLLFLFCGRIKKILSTHTHTWDERIPRCHPNYHKIYGHSYSKIKVTTLLLFADSSESGKIFAFIGSHQPPTLWKKLKIVVFIIAINHFFYYIAKLFCFQEIFCILVKPFEKSKNIT